MEKSCVETANSSKKQIAKNSILLYIRMLLSIAVSLYTSRVVLQTLGVEDYGIYGVVGGLVSMFTFLNAAMSGATSRFLNFEMGKGNAERLSKTFSTALILHVSLGLVFIIIIETFGLWFLNNKLVIPEGRLFAANFILHCSAISVFFSITQVPYNAIIISHEKMDIYAYIELLNVFLKLGIVYLLLVFSMDKLILYSILTSVVSILIAILYRLYCVRHYSESHFHFIFDRNIAKPMLGYSVWDLYGNMSVSLNKQGTDVIINMFYGIVFNAASSVATTVQTTIKSLSFNVLVAFRPQIVTSYAIGDNSRCVELINDASKFSTLTLSVVAIPLIVQIDAVLELWLGIVPEKAGIFCSLMLVSGFVAMVESSIGLGIQATGKVKNMSFITGTMYLSAVLFIYLAFKFGLAVESAYYILLVINVLVASTKLIFLKQYVPEFSVCDFLTKTMLPVLTVIILNVFVCYCVKNAINNKFLGVLLVSLTSVIISLLLSFMICLNKEQKSYVINRITKKL